MSEIKQAEIKPGLEPPGSAAAIPRCAGPEIIVVNSRRKITAISSQSARILGLAAPLQAGGSLKELPAALEKIALQSLASGEAASGLEIEFKGARGEKITAGVSVLPLREGDNATGVALAINDIGSSQQSRKTLWRIDRLANVGTLAAGMAHEIKNALVAGKTFVDLLLEKNRDMELVEVVRRELGRIDAMVSRILKFAGPDRPMIRAASVHEILEHSLRLVQPRREEKLISLKQSFRAAPDVVQGDDHQLQQAFVNLLLNALEATGPNGTLTVTTELAPGARQILVTIADDGEGIAPEHLDRLFEPFFTTKPEGTGLGLSITRRIIEDHHGTITVSSQPQKGTSFRITLPADVSAAPGS